MPYKYRRAVIRHASDDMRNLVKGAVTIVLFFVLLAVMP